MRLATLLCALALVTAIQPGWTANEQVEQGSPDPSMSNEAVVRFNGTGKDLEVFTNWNQTLTLGDPKSGATVLGVPRTIIQASDKEVCLYKGTIVVDSAASPVTIRLDDAGIHLAPHSSAIIEYKPHQFIKVQALGSESKILMRIRSGLIHDSTFKLRSNEQLTASIPNARVQMEPLRAVGQAVQVHQNNKTGRFDRISEGLQDNIELARGEYPKKVVFDQSAPLKLNGTSGTEFITSNSGTIKLICGQLLARSESGDVIHTELGDAILQRNSVASIERWQGQLRLASYCEPQAVLFKGEKGIFSLRWGQELVVTDHSPTWGDLLPNDGVARRNFEPVAASNYSCTLTDFQLGSALKILPQLAVVRKPSTKNGYKLRAKLIKTAAALELVTGQRGRFITCGDLLQSATNQR